MLITIDVVIPRNVASSIHHYVFNSERLLDAIHGDAIASSMLHAERHSLSSEFRGHYQPNSIAYGSLDR